MNEQERQIISDIFRRLETAANQPRDPEAERFIAEMLRRQPYAPYAMCQALFVQEQALTNLNEQVQQLAAENERLRSQPQSSGGGLLSSIFGGGSRPEPARPSSFGASQGGPWGHGGASVPPTGGYGGQPGYGQPGYGQPGYAPQGGPFGGGMMGGRGGGGFLGTAMATAAGVAGGMMLGSALANAFDGNNETGGGLGALASDEGGADAAGGGGGITDSLYPASGNEEDPGFGDFGGDAGDSGDWT